MNLKNDTLFNVEGLVVVVTGGTGVIGGTMAEALASNGAKVAVLGRSTEKGTTLVSRIEQAGGAAFFQKADVTDKASMEAVAKAILSKWGKIDVLVNCAGGNHPGATATPEQLFYDLPKEALQHVTDLNILGTIIPSQVIGKHMAENKKGSIINISSMSAQQPLTKVLGYGASKAAIDNFTK